MSLFHTIAAPQAVSAWQALGPGTAHWKMELDHLPESGYRIEQMVTALTDPVFGLPLTSLPHRPRQHDPEDAGIRVRLSGRRDTGILEMLYCRFNHHFEATHPHLHSAIAARIRATEGRSR